MKPPVFEYVRAENRQEVLRLIREDPDETKILAGGQSLVPMMNFRLARPSRLVDINHVRELDGVTEDDGRLKIGARVRHLTLQNKSGSDPLTSLLRRAAHQIGHLPIRTRGTFGGSLAHCDAASEWCLVARLLDADITVESEERGLRTIAAKDFFLSIFTTAMQPDELLVDVSLPLLGEDHRAGISEFARRAGDFAIVAVTTDVTLRDGIVREARVCIGGVSEVPFRSSAAEELLLGLAWPQDVALDDGIRAAAEAAAHEVDPSSDAHGSAEYRRDLVRALLPKALAQGSKP